MDSYLIYEPKNEVEHVNSLIMSHKKVLIKVKNKNKITLSLLKYLVSNFYHLKAF